MPPQAPTADAGERTGSQGLIAAHAARARDHALQDYQMQLTLLEQQNKKRLSMAHQEQNSASGSDTAVSAVTPRVPEWPSESQDQPQGYNHALQDHQMQLMFLAQQNKKRLSMARQEQNSASGSDTAVSAVTPRVPEWPDESQDAHVHRDPETPVVANTVNIGHYSQTKRPKLFHTPSNLTDDVNIPFETSNMPQGTSAAEIPAITNSIESSPSHVVLFRVVCLQKHEQCHLRMYQDEPHQVALHGVYHLSGATQVPDLVDFLQGRDEIKFIVYHESHCNQGSKSSLGRSPKHDNAQYSRAVVSIVSEELRSSLQRISKFSPVEDSYATDICKSSEDQPTFMPSTETWEISYRYLYHHRKEVHAEASAFPIGSHIQLFSSWLKNNPYPIFNECDEYFSRGLVTSKILPWLFQPNSVVLSQQGSLCLAYVLSQFPADGPKLAIDCWGWEYKGHWLRRKSHSLTVDIPTCGVTKIQDMSVYPLEYASNEVKEKLSTNGAKFWSLRQQTLISYEGPDYMGERTHPPDSRFMVDYQAYSKFHCTSEAYSVSSKATYDAWRTEIPDSAELSSLEMMLLPADIHGFSMKENKWIRLILSQVQPVTWDKDAFQRLVLPERTKNLVKGLVTIRKSKPSSLNLQPALRGKNASIIAGKGSGLIMLLHGGPGTGKTLTAESIAELAEMPLYNVNCADIGTTPEAVEKHLNPVLNRAKTWNCVLLLEEADIFLEKRSLSDLERNSLASAFLRIIECHDGVLILTSNRVVAFDEAFKSRIQLALHYPRLDESSRRKIWCNFLDILHSNQENVDFDDVMGHMDQICSHELDGRQIRTAMTTAQQLALSEQEKLNWGYIENAIAVAGDFDKYLKEATLHRHSDEQ